MGKFQGCVENLQKVLRKRTEGWERAGAVVKDEQRSPCPLPAFLILETDEVPAPDGGWGFWEVG